ncbi:hypothetical protein pb186bvf_016612 [Paramecium bursaria]
MLILFQIIASSTFDIHKVPTSGCIIESLQLIDQCDQVTPIQSLTITHSLAQCYYLQHQRDFPQCWGDIQGCLQLLNEEQWLIFSTFSNYFVILCSYNQILINTHKISSQTFDLQSQQKESLDEMMKIKQKLNQWLMANIENQQFLIDFQDQNLILAGSQQSQIDKLSQINQLLENLKDQLILSQNSKQRYIQNIVLQRLELITQNLDNIIYWTIFGLVIIMSSGDQFINIKKLFLFVLLTLFIEIHYNLYLRQKQFQNPFKQISEQNSSQISKEIGKLLKTRLCQFKQ